MRLNKTCLLFFLLTGIFFISSLRNDSRAQTDSAAIVKTQSEFKSEMRKLWEDQIVWTRNVIFNIIDGLDGTDKAVDRLRKNQSDIGDALKSYYGGEAGTKFSGILQSHITYAADLFRAMKVDDIDKLEAAKRKWYAASDEIVGFLSDANPYWSRVELTNMFYDYLSNTIDESLARVKKDYTADITAYDKVHDQILILSDVIASGIISQYPEKFSP